VRTNRMFAWTIGAVLVVGTIVGVTRLQCPADELEKAVAQSR
jgi:hypothetical protein